MARFRVIGLDSEQRLQQAQVEAPDAAQALALAATPAFRPLRVERQAGLSLPWHSGPRLDLLLFTQELVSLLEAGLTVYECLDTLADKEQQPEARRVLARLTAELREGRTFSDALEGEKALFGDIYIATVRASERTGDILPALRRFLVYRRQVDALRRKIISAAIYPALLLLSGAGVTLFMLLYLVPRFSLIYDDLGGDLPLASRLLLEWGRLLHAHTGAVLFSLTALAAAAGWALAQPAWRQWLGMRMWRVKGIGPWLRTLQLSRFYRAVSMLLQSGIPLPAALRMTQELLHPALRPALPVVLHVIEEGRPFSEALEQAGLLTPVAQRLVRVGERSGELAALLEHTADFHDEEGSVWMERFSKVLEPLLMLFIGFFVGLIVVLMYLPIFELAGSWQQ